MDTATSLGSHAPNRPLLKPMIIEHETTPADPEAGNRRIHERIAGPFDGVRVGIIDTPLRIFDLSRGGCFVNALYEQPPGSRFAMKIELPHAGLTTLRAETLDLRSEFGFAVQFVDVDRETAARLDQALEHLQARTSPSGGSSFGMTGPRVLPLSEPVWDTPAEASFRDPQPRRRTSDPARPQCARAARVRMLGSGYRVLVDKQPVALINLSLSGAQVRGAVRVSNGQPVLVDIGWPQDRLSCAAISRVRWVQAEPEAAADEMFRIGLAFETWDVRRLKEIMHHCDARTRRARSAADPW